METPNLRYQTLLQKERELKTIDPNVELSPVEYYELQILHALFAPEPKFDDLEDFANVTRALNRVSDHFQQGIIKHYYYKK